MNNTTTPTGTELLNSFASSYRGGPMGVISDIAFSGRPNIQVIRVANTTWVRPTDIAPGRASRAYKVICSEIVLVPTEDGPVTTRCGLAVHEGGHWCEGHTPDGDLDAVCEHGMSAWLCEGPGHYGE